MKKANITILRDPVKAEWLIIDLGDGHILPIHPYKDFQRNLWLAEEILNALTATCWYAPDTKTAKPWYASDPKDSPDATYL
jgi:hypothetical protein